MAKNITGNHDGKNGENETYSIVGRGNIKRELLAREVEKGKHPNFHTVTFNGVKHVRANPDGRKNNNINKQGDA